MKYYCEKCNYETHDSGNFSHHKQSKKHVHNDQQNIFKTYNKKCESDMNPICIQQKSRQVELFECKYCGETFKHHQNMYRHMKYRCQEKSEKDNKIKLLEEQNEKLMDIVQKQSNAAENNSETIKKSMNVLSFVTKQYPNAPAIEELEYDKFNKITKSLMYDKNKKKSNHSIEEIILFYFKKNKLAEILGKAIVEEYTKVDPYDQSMWASDISRLTFIVNG